MSTTARPSDSASPSARPGPPTAVLLAHTAVLVRSAGLWWVALVQYDDGRHDDQWGLPGGVVDARERVTVTAARTLRERTGLLAAITAADLVCVADDPARDPDRRAVAWLHRVRREEDDMPALTPGRGVRAARWIRYDRLVEHDLVLDHGHLIARALGRTAGM